MNSLQLDDKILALLADLRKHKGDYVYRQFMQLFELLNERAMVACTYEEGTPLYRQQGATLAMRDLVQSLNENYG